MSKQIKGVDVSSWQHPNGREIDWNAVKDAGYEFAIIKATQGTNYVNPWLERDISDVLAAGMLAGAYHYFEAGQEAVAQADYFIAQITMRQLDLGAWLDWECYPAEPFAHTQECNQFLVRAREARPGTGVYTTLSWAPILKQESVNVNRLWIVDLSGTPNDAALIQQTTWNDSVPGIEGGCDEDILLNPRGFDLPTAPTARPSAATVKTVRPEPEPESEDPEFDAVAEHTVPEGAAQWSPDPSPS